MTLKHDLRLAGGSIINITTFSGVVPVNISYICQLSVLKA